MLSVLSEIYEKYNEFHTDGSALANAIHSICSYHAPLQQGNEVSWALWLAKQMNIQIPTIVGDRISKLDDDVVALIALDLNQLGLLDATGFTKWQAQMHGANLYDNHWLIAYEAWEQGWLASPTGRDYIADDELFSILRLHGVRFYGGVAVSTASSFSY
jgi:hypothetical protein